jgi:NAD+ synthase (glutamine-hydrolysing)
MTTTNQLLTRSKALRVMSACINPTALDWQRNKDLINRAISVARSKSASLVVLPEMAISGYGCDDAFLHRMTTDKAKETLLELLPSTTDMIVLVGLPMRFQDCVYNCIAVIADGQMLGIRPKKKLANSGVHYESRWFKPWPDSQVTTIQVGGVSVPFGDLVFTIGNVTIGIELCEEAWTAGRELEHASQRGVQILCNPSASHFSLAKVDERITLVRQGSMNGNTVYVYSNLLGSDAGRLVYDGQSFIASKGIILARSLRLCMEPLTYCVADVDLSDATGGTAELVHFVPNGKSDPGCVSVADFFWPKMVARLPIEANVVEDWELSSNRTFEEFTRAVALGFMDYIEKSHAKGIVVSLSGGRDSASVICLATIGIYLILCESGVTGLQLRFPWLVDTTARDQTDAWLVARIVAKQFITTVYQRSKHSSVETGNAARVIAEAVGTSHHAISIEALVSEVESLVSSSLGITLDALSSEHDVACQNIQARARSQFAWVLANLEHKLLIPPSNRSEAAVGYCTMDGDTAGGFNPIGSVGKSFINEWLLWLEQVGLDGELRIPELGCINAQAPTAELQPQEMQQTDEKDLGPFVVRDFIEQAFLTYRRTPDEVRLLVIQQFGKNYGPEQLLAWTAKYFQNFSASQWKRERLAPSLFVAPPNLDPRSWCRWPILSGGLE